MLVHSYPIPLRSLILSYLSPVLRVLILNKPLESILCDVENEEKRVHLLTFCEEQEFHLLLSREMNKSKHKKQESILQAQTLSNALVLSRNVSTAYLLQVVARKWADFDPSLSVLRKRGQHSRMDAAAVSLVLHQMKQKIKGKNRIQQWWFWLTDSHFAKRELRQLRHERIALISELLFLEFSLNHITNPVPYKEPYCYKDQELFHQSVSDQ